MAGCGGDGLVGPLTAHTSQHVLASAGFLDAGGARRTSWFTPVILYTKVLRYRGACPLLRFPEQCSQQRYVQSPFASQEVE